MELDIYAKYLDRVKEMSNKQGTALAFTAGIFTFCSTSYFGYTFYLSGVLRSNEVKNNPVIKMDPNGEDIYTGGTCCTIVWCFMIGLMRFSQVPIFKKFVTDGLVASQEAFDVIDKVPAVDPNQKGKIVTRDQMKGEYQFTNVNFSYPSNKVQVLKNFTCTFEAGKTTAFVGPSGSGKSTVI